MEDVPLLVQYFVEKFARELDRPVTGISEAALQCILEYEFPGNVRELENTIERAVALSRGEIIEREVLPPALLEPRSRTVEGHLPEGGAKLDELVDEYERRLLGEALARCGGVKKHAAALLGISFRSFRYRLEKLGLDREEAGGP